MNACYNVSLEHCCEPLCSASGRYNSTLSFHCFPKNASLQAKWIHKVRRTGFTVTQHTKVCSRHFKPHEIVTSKKGRRALVAGAVPSLFEWNNYSTKERPGVWERRARPPSPEPDVLEPAAAEPVAIPMVMDHDYEAAPTVCVDRQHYEQLKQEIDALLEQLKTCHLQKNHLLEIDLNALIHFFYSFTKKIGVLKGWIFPKKFN
uniref:THAP domain-containing protein 1 n=1 Tax=Sander lucioperca TaxID=283035 RepID=A0A8C9XCU8_SANLU